MGLTGKDNVVSGALTISVEGAATSAAVTVIAAVAFISSLLMLTAALSLTLDGEHCKKDLTECAHL